MSLTRLRGMSWLQSVFVALVFCGTLGWVSAASAAAANNGEKPPSPSMVVVTETQSRKPRIHSQLADVSVPVGNHYMKADSIAFALAIVPDPLVPRYRRLYDLELLALELGMLKDGYVLDRFGFPWSEELRRDGESEPSHMAANESNITSGLYGLMIFRCDGWRGDSCNHPDTPEDSKQRAPAHTRIRALYVVTETATSGVARFPLECAIREMESQVAGQKPEPPTAQERSRQCTQSDRGQKGVVPTFLLHPSCPVSENGEYHLVVLGPSFSGAMNSLGETVEGRIPNAKRKLCLVSSFATDATNERIPGKYPSLVYRGVALDNGQKLEHLQGLAQSLGAGQYQNVAILAEASTFGYGICAERGGNAQAKVLCDRSTKFYFPPTIADIAYGIHKQQAQQANELLSATQQVRDDHHLSLEGGAENGSEFPASESPAVTAASNQLQLDQVMEALVSSAPKIIVVAATDVRDRLFLFDQLRERLPRAMLVDLEADNLLTHPEFLHASRGAIAAASVNLNSVGSVFPGCNRASKDKARASWSTDGQGILADGTAHLYETGTAAPASHPPCTARSTDTMARRAALQLVTFHGFKPVSQAFADDPVLLGESDRPNFGWLIPSEWLACLFCMALGTLWLWPWSLQRGGTVQTGDAVSGKRREKLVVGTTVALAALFLPLALYVAHNSAYQIGHPFMYWLVALELVGMFGAVHCYRKIRSTLWAAGHATYSSLWISAFLAIAALGFAVAATWVSTNLPLSEPWIDSTLLNSLGFDPSSGVAFYLVAVVAGVMTLYASATVATRIWVVRRNFRLLVLARNKVTNPKFIVQPISFVPTGEKSQIAHSLHGYKPLPTSVTVLVSAFIILIAAVPGLLEYLGGPRLTVFGPVAARVAVLALAATTVCATILMIAAYGAGRRVIALCGYVRGRILENKKTATGTESEIPGLWTGGAEMPNAFAATPVLAIDCGAGTFSRRIWTGDTRDSQSSAEEAGQAWAEELSKILYRGEINSKTQFALFALLVSELSLFRWIAMGAVLCAFASVAIVFLYPIEADSMLVLNLVILALAGVLCAYMAVVFECDGVLSNIVCNRPQKAAISIGLFSFIASPFIALAAAIALVEIPGVVDWAGGLFVMMRSLGIHP